MSGKRRERKSSAYGSAWPVCGYMEGKVHAG